ncbi:hypothetical protein CEUSTIGMA_g11567.t1 [Chlamydomonas eustigma]|uniref:Uncharacterized protein n=1 Tax=Chlamydomonas eustigma TaxID=1157962 RepID=A0A250XM38_9CHLO|nr:hypothetical protein CEUSTIGMA_g11567.t1 [Chlamydomonas eustigma]|eukprot:GAX84144.1 hypothetical protein CEUSTIGMA_g11567.t1 [Chlamydomonas eustigma]
MLRHVMSLICLFFTTSIASPIGFPSGPYATNGAFTLFQDLETFLSAQASCLITNPNEYARFMLASADSQKEWNEIVSLAENFWSNTTNGAVLNYTSKHIVSPLVTLNESAVSSSSSGFNSFEGCVWIGLSNVQTPQSLIGDSSTMLQSVNSITFLDGTPTADFFTNIRTTPSLQVSGWPQYGAKGTGEIAATCSMLCITPSSNSSSPRTYYAECSSIALPYICKATVLVADTTSITVASNSEGRRLKTVEEVVSSTRRQSSALSPSSSKPASSFSIRRLLSSAAPAPSAPAASAASATSAPAANAHSTSAANAHSTTSSASSASESSTSSWPPLPTLVPTLVGNASCFPFGSIELCTFPTISAFANLTQADWMYTCWQAGLEPLSVYTYSQLYMLIYGSTVYNVPAGTAATAFFTQGVMSGVQQLVGSRRSVSYTFNDNDLLSSQLFNNWLYGMQIPGLPNYTTTATASTSPYYTIVDVIGIPAVANCSAFGFGCAYSLVFPSSAQGYFGSGVITSLTSPAGALNTTAWLITVPNSSSSSSSGGGHGRRLRSAGGVNTFVLSSASALQGGMCQRVNPGPMPRPSGAVTAQAWILFQFTMSNEVLDGILGIQPLYTQFLTDVQAATAGALPDISISDVIIPEESPAFQMYNDLLSNTSGLSLMGVILVVNMPWMINTSALINGYTQYLVTSPFTLLPPSFLQAYGISAAQAIVTQTQGNLDYVYPPGADTTALGLGLGIGLGLPFFAGLLYFLYYFIKDANSASKAVSKREEVGGTSSKKLLGSEKDTEI